MPHVVSHRPLNGGKLRSGDFKIFLLRMNVNVFHCGEVFPTTHGLKHLVIHACTMSTGSESVPEAVRRFAIYIDGLLYTLPEASVSLKG